MGEICSLSTRHLQGSSEDNGLPQEWSISVTATSHVRSRAGRVRPLTTGDPLSKVEAGFFDRLQKNEPGRSRIVKGVVMLENDFEVPCQVGKAVARLGELRPGASRHLGGVEPAAGQRIQGVKTASLSERHTIEVRVAGDDFAAGLIANPSVQIAEARRSPHLIGRDAMDSDAVRIEVILRVDQPHLG